MSPTRATVAGVAIGPADLVEVAQQLAAPRQLGRLVRALAAADEVGLPREAERERIVGRLGAHELELEADGLVAGRGWAEWRHRAAPGRPWRAHRCYHRRAAGGSRAARSYASLGPTDRDSRAEPPTSEHVELEACEAGGAGWQSRA